MNHWSNKLWKLGACPDARMWAQSYDSFPEALDAALDAGRSDWIFWLWESLFYYCDDLNDWHSNNESDVSWRGWCDAFRKSPLYERLFKAWRLHSEAQYLKWLERTA